MRRLARLAVAAGLVLAGGLALPGGAAQAAACSGTTGVTVVIDYGSSSTTLCSPGDPSSAGAALRAVAAVAYVPMYGEGVVCKINSVPSNQTCQRMPPSSAYWAFFHATRGGSWTYSSTGVADYNPAAGSVIGFAFGSGGAPSSAPPGATAPPTPKPSPSSSSSRPPAPKPTSKPAATTPARPGGSGTAAGSTSSGSSPAAGSPASRAATPRGATTGPTAPTRPAATTSTTATSGTSTSSTPAADPTSAGEAVATPGAQSPGSGSTTTLLAGLGLVGLVGAGAAYLALRRRATG